ncbi:MAG: hypothetical protein SPE23_07585 [Sodaliphilus sp.]|nr:hypothetical protein [Sodaliphilus sp.]
MIDIQYDIIIMGGREVSRPYRVGFSPKASGFCPFGDATGIAKRLFFMFFVLVFLGIYPLKRFLFLLWWGISRRR